MRIVQRTFLYLISILIIAAGAAIAAFPFSEQVVFLAHQIASNWMLCLLVGCTAAALGVFTLLPFDLFHRKGRSVSFAGPTGTVSIQIDPFETSLRKTIAKLPMVKRVSVTVTPKDNDRKVGIEAVVSLKKPAEASTRETAERLREFIDKVSRQILGADEIMTVDVRIEDVLIDPTQTAESLNGIFAAAEKTVAPVQKSVAPLAATAAASSVAASRPAQQTTAYGQDEDELDVASDVDTEAADDQPHSSDLLTYEEAAEMRHARASDGVAGGPSSEPADDGQAQATSFDSLADDSTEGDDSKPEAKA